MPEDIFEQKRDLASALLALHETALNADEQQIIQSGLESAEKLTGSSIGYFHFVNDDQETIELVTWSKGTLAHCTAVYERHYPINSAGVWADCFRFKRPFIHNDYQSIPDRQGYPEGHAHLVRHLGVPVIDGNKVRVLTGVGNKKSEYIHEDIETLQRIADTVWLLVKRHREQCHLLADQQRMREVQNIASVTAWECDPEDNTIKFDHMFAGIFDCDSSMALPNTIDEFLSFIANTDREKVQVALKNASADSYFHIDIYGHNKGGQMMSLSMRGQVESRPRGEGVLIHGILQDYSERQVMDEIRFKAFHDPLTGLANRNMLFDRMMNSTSSFRRNPGDIFALHYVDLDRFKDINDKLGHQIGDEVLKEVARRIHGVIRKEDLAVRYGGDEFLILQNSVSDEKDATLLAEKIISVIGQPYMIEGQTLEVGASIGIALSRPEMSDINLLISESDEALYRSKSMVRCGYELFRKE